jgi:hypothetical protein
MKVLRLFHSDICILKYPLERAVESESVREAAGVSLFEVELAADRVSKGFRLAPRHMDTVLRLITPLAEGGRCDQGDPEYQELVERIKETQA